MQSTDSRQGKAGQLAVATGVLVLGMLMALGTMQLPEATGYAKVGPRLVPAIVSGGLMLSLRKPPPKFRPAATGWFCFPIWKGNVPPTSLPAQASSWESIRGPLLLPILHGPPWKE